jgi:endonuclease/exonuclease/phosphatase family metal-dependent hydrolase
MSALQGGSPPPAAPAKRPQSGAASTPTSFKVASFNILYVNKDLKAIAATIRQADADVICLQETNEDSERFLRGQLAKTYPFMTFQGADFAGGLGILSKVPLRNVRRVPPKFGVFGTAICEANLAGRSVQIVDAHLYPTIPPRDANLRTLLRAWQQAEAVRAKEVPYILDGTPTRLPRIFAGDLNCQPGGTATELLKDKGFLDSLVTSGRDPNGVTTCKETFQGMTMGFRLDYVLHTKELSATDCQVIPTPASDHALVLATLRWAVPASQPANRP